MIRRLSGGSQAGRAEAAKKYLEKLRSENKYVSKPFRAKQRSFRFPTVERMGDDVLSIDDLTHGYGDKKLFEHCDLFVQKGERIAIIGPNGSNI